MRTTYIIVLFAFLLPFSLKSYAQNETSNTPEVLESLFACKTIEDAEARLACYDEGVGRVEQAQSTGELVAIDKEAAEQIKRDSFGFNIPSLPKFAFPKLGTDGREDEFVTLEVENYRIRPRGEYVFYTSNGQTWEQTDGTIRRVPKGGFTLEIKPAALGSYLARIDGEGRSFRVKRRE